jgi:membrane-bound lytic murein transglycosylase A
MIAQDTGSAIIGPARADLYFGAGADAGRVSGRLRHPMHFCHVGAEGPRSSLRGAKLPVPDPRPVGEDRKAVSADRSCQGFGQGSDQAGGSSRSRGTR